ncbi:MAG: enoyl-CoA hydratase-related protein [Pseudomonadota bacterium]
MSAYRYISASSDGAVTTLRLSRPDKLNAMLLGVVDELGHAVDGAVAGGARALVLTGEGRLFCSGADLTDDEMGGSFDDLGLGLETHYNPFLRKLAALDIPVITALNGPVAGGGVGIALSGDIVVMGEGGYILLPFANIGLVPDVGATWLIGRSIGRARLLEMALLGERLKAEDAKAAGLVTRVVPDADVLPTAQALAARLASGPTRAYGAIRRQVAFALDNDFDATLDLERVNQRLCGRTHDAAEAITAFGHKRKPTFKGQ